LKGGARGKYYRQLSEGTNLVLIDPDLDDAFPDTKSVNDAPRVLANIAATRVRSSRRNKPA
jgi:hypothetical protein